MSFADHYDYAQVHQIEQRGGHSVSLFYADEMKFKGADFSDEDRPDFHSGPRLHEHCVKLCRRIVDNLDLLEARARDRQDPGLKGTVLVFLPGEAEILEVKRALVKDHQVEDSGWDILLLHSKVPQEDIQ